ncbi:outer membrane beta-barrel protein [Pseudoduganella sp. DS3]|uniref:Outer membrane beta-barrel protein n=1 Tax=Pseudoduganella guangdongensis TaxID=2692179 RepID=A0A6N9HIP9_9BURK|nr:porin family protein [Pseudoduganella guangdongensis]MYN03229.1 outer membrane beta-barrel protein [Pseudoduganella guangdongensis]
MHYIRHFIACGLLAVAAPAFAQSVYLSTDVGRASVSSKYADSGNDATVSFAVGYQYKPHLAFELYTRGLSLDPFRGAFADAGYYPDSHYGVAAVASTGLADSLSLFGRAGLGRTTMKSNRANLGDKHETEPVLGAGVSYALGRNWSLNLEASYLTKSEASLLTVGARVQF